MEETRPLNINYVNPALRKFHSMPNNHSLVPELKVSAGRSSLATPREHWSVYLKISILPSEQLLYYTQT